ncbi:ABC transporter substrate-binding protein [Saccharospirillum salsuginis]|uniref:Sulfonate/nitrate/taurine transport system substrate-binding protein n=1 Tax=Saccharospirillum salsuginis TaxID=418750 RepID=A0A918NGN5_9GAMM|nr:hypothetical protein [Saccharospirillum salsuginis]GGX66219.1 sulfonate/nitrate/taurine transport system substrate-binding protein [Saccharospirillum salsuginis]
MSTQYRLRISCLPLLGLIMMAILANLAWAKDDRITLAGPSAAVSFPLAYLVATGGLDHLADEVEFRLWSTPDQLRTLAMDGQADFMAMPSNVIANLNQRGAPVQLVNISTWGILWIVSRGEAADSLAALKGQEIVMPFRGDMPDIVFNTLAEQQGLDTKADFDLRYVATPVDAMQLLLSRQADHVVLAEPAISMALNKANTLPTSLVAPELTRSLSLQDEWGRVFERAPEMPQAGIAAVGKASRDRALIAAVNQAYDEALQQCLAEPTPCAEAIAPLLGGRLSVKAIADALAVSPLHTKAAPQARDELEFFYRTLADRQPALIGGQLPDESFYQWPNAQ